MFFTPDDQKKYISENYEDVTDSRMNEENWDIFCDKCKVVRGFQVEKRAYTEVHTQYFTHVDWRVPQTIFFICPVCKSHKIWVVFRIFEETDDEKVYKITSIPNEGIEDIEGIPESPVALRKAFKEAIRSYDSNSYMAAAAMFRRALQIITRQILNAKPDTLDKELKSLVGTKYNGVTLTNDFADIGYIIKEAGNQGAHPDKDPDLLEFTKQDAKDLQEIFMQLVSDLFITPEASKKAKVDFLGRRKIRV